MTGCFWSKSVLTLKPLLQHEREFGPLVQAASATNEVEDDALLAEEAAFDDADAAEDTDEVAFDVDDALDVEEALLVVEEEATRRTILPIRSAPHR